MSDLITSLRRWMPIWLSIIFLGNQASIPAQSPTTAEVASLQDGGNVARRLDVNTRRLQQTQQFNHQLAQMLATIPQPSEEALTKIADRTRTLQMRLTFLQNALTDFTTTNAIGTNAIPELEKQLAEVEKERDLLVKKQTEALDDVTATNSTRGWRNLLKRSDLTPIPIVLVKNRVVPKMQPFFSVRTGYVKDPLTGKNIAAGQISRVLQD